MHHSQAKPSRIGPGLLLTALLHLLLLRALLTAQRPGNPAPATQRPAILWLRPLPITPSASTRLPAARPPARTPAPLQALASKAAPQPITLPAAPDAPAETPPAPTLPNAADIMAQARRDIGQIDRELRQEYPQRAAAPPESKLARLARGIEAAHDAVPPKWYEGARTVELSQPNSLTHVFKVSTALLTYCITIDAEGHKNYTSCP